MSETREHRFTPVVAWEHHSGKWNRWRFHVRPGITLDQLVGLRPGEEGRPDQGLPGQGTPGQGLPGQPDQGLPPTGGQPDQGLPGRQPVRPRPPDPNLPEGSRPDQGLPGGPEQGLPDNPDQELPEPPEDIDNSLPENQPPTSFPPDEKIWSRVIAWEHHSGRWYRWHFFVRAGLRVSDLPHPNPNPPAPQPVRR